MKYKLTWKKYEGDSETSMEGEKYLSSITEDIDKLIEFGYKIFKLEVKE